MVRSVVSKVMWVGRATVFLVGLVVILALVFGVVSRATAHDGFAGVFHLGHNNAVSALSTLVGTEASPILRVENKGSGTAVDLRVQEGQAPMKVNRSEKVANFNADKVDGRDAPLWALVNAHGMLLRSNGATSSSQTNTGDYRVRFNKDVSACAYGATIGGNASFEVDGTIQATRGLISANDVSVHTENLSGADSDRAFHLIVAC